MASRQTAVVPEVVESDVRREVGESAEFSWENIDSIFRVRETYQAGTSPLDRDVTLLKAGTVDKDRERSYHRKPATTTYTTYHNQVGVISSYRKINNQFDHQLFRRVIELCITPGKVAVQQPRKTASGEAFEAFKRTVEPPFQWFNTKVNQHLKGKLGGVMELAGWVLEHLLEGGLCGYDLRMKTVDINGVKWRVPYQVQVFSGQQLGCDKEESTFESEQWYVRVGDPEKQSEGSFRLGAWDTTDYSDRSQWEPLVDTPDLGYYRDVVKFHYAEGSTDKYPRPPYLPLLDDLLETEMLRRDDLANLAYRQRSTVIWNFDFKLMKELGIPWKDIQMPDGTKKKGAMTYFSEMRSSFLSSDSASIRDMSLPNFITFTEVSPGLDLLTAHQKYRHAENNVNLAAGLIFDNEGRLIEPESPEQKEAQFFYIRDVVLEPFIQHIYDIIIAENRKWFGVLNGVPRTSRFYDPFTFMSPAALRKKQPADTLASRTKYNERLLQLRLDGDIEDVVVHFEFVPSSARKDRRLQELSRVAERGGVSWETFQEAAGLDPSLERSRKARQLAQDWVDTPNGKQSTWTAPATYNQMAAKADGSYVETKQARSPGRPAGVTESTGSDDADDSA